MGRKSLIGCPNITCAGLIPVSLSGVFLWVRSALLKLSVSRLPVVDTLSLSILLADLTPNSARWLEWGKWAEESLCLTAQSFRNFLVV